MIIATAGHVDHGKTKLVEALSGVNTDRLPEEKQRGLTIDLGFAYVPVAGGGILGFVDVPGHEKFIRNMVAGVSAIDYALLVIAADDGPMPQTVEHLAILDLLGVTAGAVAITKTDAVADSRIDEVKQAVREIVRGSGLEQAEIFPLSALSGEGVPALKSHLENAAREFSAAPPQGRFRLAIDRMFNLTGAGLVVTGSVYSGRVAVGEKLLLSPAGAEVRVRALHVHDRAAEVARQGERAALNLAGPGARRSDIRRGDWLLHPVAHAPTRRIDAELRVLPSEAKPFKHETPAHLHLGALETPCRVAVLNGREIAPGESGLVQIVAERLITAHARDRLILRDQSARRTLAGGRVVDPYGPERGRARPPRLAQLDAMAENNPAAALAALLPLSPGGLDLSRFAVARNLDAGESTALFAAEEMVTAGGPTALAGMSLERVRHRQNQKGDSQGSQKVIQAMSWVKGGQPWMTRPYSEDLRERVVRVVESGTSRNAAAKQFDVSISFVVKLMQRWKQRGTIKADKYGGWKKSKLAPHGDRIRALVMENCDITIDELCVLLAAEGIEAKRSTLGDFLLAQGLSRKKRQPTPPSRSALTSRRREPLGATSNLG